MSLYKDFFPLFFFSFSFFLNSYNRLLPAAAPPPPQPLLPPLFQFNTRASYGRRAVRGDTGYNSALQSPPPPSIALNLGKKKPNKRGGSKRGETRWREQDPTGGGPALLLVARGGAMGTHWGCWDRPTIQINKAKT